MTRFLPIVLVACTSPRAGLAIDRVDPASGPSTQSTMVRIEGAGFHLPILSDVDEGSTIVQDMAVEVGGVPLAEWSWQDEQVIRGTVPAGLALGPHDVFVRLGREEGVLPGGFVVTDQANPGDGGTLPCTFGPWSAPQAIAELNTSNFEAMPRLSPDELAIYFHSQRAGGSGDRDLWTATRTSTTAPFGTPVNLTQLNTTAADRDPAPAGDGLAIVFSSARTGSLDLYGATRASLAQPFSAPVPLAGVNTTGTEYFAFLSADGLTLYWSSTRGGDADLWYATRPTTASDFGTPTNRSDVSSTAGEFAPVLSGDGLELYFASNRSGDTDIWVSTRADTASAFGTPVRIPELSTAGNEDLPAWLSPDKQRLYLSSGVVSTTAALYVATRSCL